jgi:Kelch motif/Galactose oxidase, central domain
MSTQMDERLGSSPTPSVHGVARRHGEKVNRDIICLIAMGDPTLRISLGCPDQTCPGEASKKQIRPTRAFLLMRALRRPVALLFAIVLLGLPALMRTQTVAASGEFWSPAGSLAISRVDHTSTLLPNGKVLVTGGGVGATATAELYDPVANSWSAAASMTAPRANHTATLLPSGKVLVVGGYQVTSAELYDPLTDTWATTGSPASTRQYHTATLLATGEVLIAGGESASGGASQYVAVSELYDPTTGSWTSTGALSHPRVYHTATLLASGEVLIAGGIGSGTLASAEIYDPAAGVWTPAAAMATARNWHTATLLLNGTVIVAGGSDGVGYTLSTELYDPLTNSWSAAGNLTATRYWSAATRLPNGDVLTAGGLNANGNGYRSSAETYDPATNTWSATGDLESPRGFLTLTPLQSGKVLAVGGIWVNLAEIYGSGRDHKSDANGDGYSAADEATVANCGGTSCDVFSPFGTAETRSCKDAGRKCGTPGAPADDTVPARIAVPPADGYGCDSHA